jgi:hypothetical protein
MQYTACKDRITPALLFEVSILTPSIFRGDFEKPFMYCIDFVMEESIYPLKKDGFDEYKGV